MKGLLFKLTAVLLILSGPLLGESYYCPPGECTSTGGFWVRGDYLYWRPCVDGLALAVFQLETYPENGGSSAVSVPGIGEDSTAFVLTDRSFEEHIAIKSDDWASAFRFGIGYRAGESSCDYALNWVHFSPNQSSKVLLGDFKPKAKEGFIQFLSLTPANGLALSPTLTGMTILTESVADEGGCLVPPALGLVNLNAAAIKSRWDLDLDLVDLEFGHGLECGCLSLRPYASLRYASIDQKLKLRSNGNLAMLVCSETENPIPEEFLLGVWSADQHLKDTFSAIGPRVGLGALYEIGCGWGVFGNFAAALLYGDFDSKYHENATRTLFQPTVEEYSNDLQSQFDYHRKSSKRCSSPNTDVEIGLYFQTTRCFCDSSYDLELAIGWEHHYFFGQGLNNTSHATSHFKKEDHDLSTQGVSVSLAIGF